MLNSRFWEPDKLFYYASKASVYLFLLIFLAFLLLLIKYSYPSLVHDGLQFITHVNWAPHSDKFGAFSIIVGTLITGLLSLIIAVPLSLALAILIVFYLPSAVSVAVSRLIDLLSGIPSIIFGMWGLFYLVPYLSQQVQPKLIGLFEAIPVLNRVFAGIPIGVGYFTAAIILAIMIIPYICSLTREIMLEVPKELTEAAYALGCTEAELIFSVVIPYIRAGLLGTIILGLGRALGETMAVTFVIGNAHDVFLGLFMPGSTIASTVANEFAEAAGKLHQAALFELGLVLFLISALFLFLSRLILHHAHPRGGNL